jgi:hypothetical protein
MFRKVQHSFLIVISSFFFMAASYGQCQISGPSNITVSNAPGVCGANVTYSATAGNCTLSYAPASGSFFQVGTSNVTVTAMGQNGTQSTYNFTVTVNDTEGPKITNVSATPNSLWPPNHKMQDVMVNYNVTDNCPGNITCGLTVSSNEPVNDIGDGNTEPDWIVLDAHRVQLRAERAGPLNGRVYTITVGCRDLRNNLTTANTIVTVPHDQGKNKYSDLSMSIAPNPSKSSFILNINSDDATSRIYLTISDLQGRVLETKSNLNPKQAVTVGNNLRPGTYIVKVQQGDSSTEERLIKQ